MRPEELMIGDWYSWEAEGKKYYYQVTKETFSLLDDDIFNFQAVPLTQEILEKNEFKNIRDNEVFLLNKISSNVNLGICFDSNDIHIYLQDNNSGSWPGYEYYELFDIKYVHELQHALKLCGIDKTIEL